MRSQLKFILTFATVIIFSGLFANKLNPQSSDTPTISQANTAKHYKGLSFQERKVIFYINLARMDGKMFARTYLADYVKEYRVPKNKYYKSLVKKLNEMKALPPLVPKEDLVAEAVKHATEMGKSGRKGHRSADHKGFIERMEPFNKKYAKMKECNQYGYPEAIEIVIDLLIDDDNEGLTHRKALLHKDLKYVGIGIRAHKKWKINSSILFGGELLSESN